MGGKLIDLTGLQVGTLTVIDFAGRFNKVSYWNCICTCGRTTRVRGGSLNSGHLKSCGCLTNDIISKFHTKHGHARTGLVTKEYRCWLRIKVRCDNPNFHQYADYGGRGITVCQR